MYLNLSLAVLLFFFAFVARLFYHQKNQGVAKAFMFDLTVIASFMRLFRGRKKPLYSTSTVQFTLQLVVENFVINAMLGEQFLLKRRLPTYFGCYNYVHIMFIDIVLQAYIQIGNTSLNSCVIFLWNMVGDRDNISNN